MLIPYGMENDYYKIKNKSIIETTNYEENGIYVKCQINNEIKNKYGKYII